MIIKSIKLDVFKRFLLFCFIILLVYLLVYFTFFSDSNLSDKYNTINSILNSNIEGQNYINDISNISIDDIAEESNDKSSYIKWVDFNATSSVLKKLSDLDISSHNNNDSIQFNWIELMAYLGCKYGGDLASFNQSDLDTLTQKLKNGESISDITSNMKLYNYFYESYDAIFHEYIGEYEIENIDENGIKTYSKKYGLKAFLPIAKNYSFSHYKDFGTSRSYGYKRLHLGNDLLRKYWNTYYSSRIWLYRISRLESIWWLENWY